MSELQIFNYRKNEVRTVMIDGEPWFVLKDVCRVLDISHVKDTADRLDLDEVGQTEVTDRLGRKQTATIINESGLYAVILRSDKPEAKPFRKWVTTEVLPSIRKKGIYASEALSSEKLLAKALLAAQRALEAQKRQMKELEEENLRLLTNTPSAIAWNDGEYQQMLLAAATAGREDYITLLYLGRHAGLQINECFAIDMRTAKEAAEKQSLVVQDTSGYERIIPLPRLIFQRFQWHISNTQDKFFVPRNQTEKEAQAAFQSFFDYYAKWFQHSSKAIPLTFDSLRYAYAMEQYEAFIRSGKSPYEARLAVSKLLGHGRDDVTKIYLASLKESNKGRRQLPEVPHD